MLTTAMCLIFPISSYLPSYSLLETGEILEIDYRRDLIELTGRQDLIVEDKQVLPRCVEGGYFERLLPIDVAALAQ